MEIVQEFAKLQLMQLVISVEQLILKVAGCGFAVMGVTGDSIWSAPPPKKKKVPEAYFCEECTH